MNQNKWEIAFQKAIEVEAEGAQYFQDIIHVKKRKLNQEDEGGFLQSQKLNKFVKLCQNILENGESITSNTTETLNEDKIDDTVNDIVHSQISNQVCRAWLKFKYLGKGDPCKVQNCPRRHMIKGNPEALYKDYAFKGMNINHRKAIISAIKQERENNDH